jgi:hypothetical protein
LQKDATCDRTLLLDYGRGVIEKPYNTPKNGKNRFEVIGSVEFKR